MARTSHGTFYLYFSNKEDLLRALVSEAAEVVSALDDALGPVGPGPEGWEELRDWMESFSTAWQRYAPVLRAWTDLLMSDAELNAQAQAAAGGVASTLARRIAQAGPQAGIDPNTAAEAVVAMVDRFHYLRQFAGRARGRVGPQHAHHHGAPGPVRRRRSAPGQGTGKSSVDSAPLKSRPAR